MPEVVGTAYVRIKAITTGLAKDIEDAVNKGAAEANVDKAGSTLSSNVGKSMTKDIEKEITPAIEDGVTKGSEKVDTDPAGNAISRKLHESIRKGSDKESGNTFASITKKLGDLFKNFKLPMPAVFGALAAPVVSGSLKIITDLIANVVAQVGFLAQAFGSLGVVAAGAGVGLGLAIFPLMLSLKAATPELDKFKKSMATLKKPFLDIAQSAQHVFFPALEDTLKTLAKLTPMFKGFVTDNAQAAGNFVKNAASILTASKNTGAWTVILDQSKAIFDDLLSVIQQVIRTLLPFLKVVMPLSRLFADAIRDLANRWLLLVQARAESGGLTTTLTIWFEWAMAIIKAFGDLLTAIKNVFKIGASTAAPFFESFRKFSADFRAFTESKAGQDRIKAIFDNARPVVHEVWLILKDIIGFITRPLLSGGSQNNIVGVLETIRTKILPPLEQMLQDASGKLAKPLMNLFDALSKVFKGDTLASAIDILAGFVDIWAKLLELPGVGTLISDVAGMALALALFNRLTNLSTVAIGLSKFAIAYGKLKAAQAAGTTSDLTGLAAALGFFGTLDLVGIAAGLAGIAVAAGLIFIAFKNWGTITDTVQK